MNLHGIVAPYVGAINPPQLVSISASVGYSVGADGSQVPAYATPGAITASIGGTLTASIPDPTNPTTLVVSAVLTGSLQVGDAVSGTDGANALPAGCSILSQISGTPGGVGSYQLSAAATLNLCTVTAASTVLNATAVTAGALQAGQTLSGAGLLANTTITGFLSGISGGAGLYSISERQTVASESMATSMTILAQVQALTSTDLRHVDMLNIQGVMRAFYFNGQIRGGARVALKGGDVLTMPNGDVYLVTQEPEPWYDTAGWTKVIATLQDGS